MRTSTCAHYLKSYFSCLLSSLLGFWMVLKLFWVFANFLPLIPLLKRGKVQETPTVAQLTRLNSITLISGKLQRPEILLQQSKVGKLFCHSQSEVLTQCLSRENINVLPFWMCSTQTSITLQSPGPSTPTAIVQNNNGVQVLLKLVAEGTHSTTPLKSYHCTPNDTVFLITSPFTKEMVDEGVHTHSTSPLKPLNCSFHPTITIV